MDCDVFVSCPGHWPNALQKAVNDNFVYAACIRDIGVVTFEEAEIVRAYSFGCHGSVEINPDWVRLLRVVFTNGCCGFDSHAGDIAPLTFDRGLEVRVSDIVWVADAPWGS